jgi:6-phosphogluconolactonase (cycloisomerase 2 family)
MTNSRSGNEVLVFSRSGNGALAHSGTFSTGGLGTGTNLRSQGAVRLSSSGRRLFVTNPGSNDISMFRVSGSDLELLQRIPSGGQRPISLATRGNRIFVLNAGGANGSNDNITSFDLNPQGTLSRIPGSTQSLSGPSTDPTQIAISRDGMFLIVTERATNSLTIFSVNFDGTTNQGTTQQFNGLTPSGFALGNGGRVFVSEAGNGGVNASTISSFEISSVGDLQPISNSVPSLQTGGSSLALSNNGQFGFVANGNSGTLTGFRVGSDGSINLLNPDGVTADVGVGSSPIELAFSDSSGSLFTLNSGTNELSTFRMGDDGSLSLFGTNLTGLPSGVNGLAAQ